MSFQPLPLPTPPVFPGKPLCLAAQRGPRASGEIEARVVGGQGRVLTSRSAAHVSCESISKSEETGPRALHARSPHVDTVVVPIYR